MTDFLDFETLQHFADSWGLAYMVVLFTGILIFILRPKAKANAAEAAMIPILDDAEHGS
jgi:cytochrome c oxidase cbb3-type subunit 4